MERGGEEKMRQRFAKKKREKKNEFVILFASTLVDAKHWHALPLNGIEMSVRLDETCILKWARSLNCNAIFQDYDRFECKQWPIHFIPHVSDN